MQLVCFMEISHFRAYEEIWKVLNLVSVWFVAFFATSFSYLMKINIVAIESVESSRWGIATIYKIRIIGKVCQRVIYEKH